MERNSRFKYPRTFHLSWSRGVQSDDKLIKSMDNFIGRRVVVTEKMDGENTSLYNDGFHARSIDSRMHPTRAWVKKFLAERQHNIPERWRVCGENLFAKHSIKYTALPSLFLGFSIWDENNTCLSWENTMEWFELLNITPVTVLYEGVYDEGVIKNLWDNSRSEQTEGYVVRLADSFHYDQFSSSVAKFVRENHVQTDTHWMHSSIEQNTMLT